MVRPRVPGSGSGSGYGFGWSHVFCSFLALLLRRELQDRLEKAGHVFEWADIKRDLEALQEIAIDENGRKLSVRTECRGVCGKVFQAVRVAIPQVIREIP